ncbi:amino acid permease [Liquorilactobacillus sicerae]|uniref:amino acid permease n=1 Tax=Liquorilactobacillus sicerae TaxID=1416943 RepID=UPI0024816B41|nr:amino acid permease [Liquorilactobacillus sicerae]
MKDEIKSKVGLGGLIALVIGGTIGSGIFALPATMTQNANPEGILIGWTIVAIGMLSLVFVYRNLTLQQPEIDDGIYGWSKNMFGNVGGFIAAYGHGAGDSIGNSSYLTVLFSAFGSFTIFRFFGNGTTWAAVITSSVLLWIVVFMVSKGVKTETWLNNVTTIAKVIPIALFIILALLNFSPHIFMAHFSSTQIYNTSLGKWTHVSIFSQSKSVLLAAMWTLIGVESGTIFATRAKKLSDVAKATTIGATVVILLLVGTSILSLGLMVPKEISNLHDPSMAGLMEHMVGSWGGWLINICLIISVLGALIAWVNLSAEETRLAGRGGSSTRWLNGLNKNEAPINSLIVTAGITQVLMIVAGIYSAGYRVLLEFSTSLSIVPYLMVSLYALKSAIKGTGFNNKTRTERISSGAWAVLAVSFSMFMIYGAGLKYLLLAAIVWLTGLPLYWKGKIERNEKWDKFEKSAWSIITLMALTGIYGLFTGNILFN